MSIIEKITTFNPNEKKIEAIMSFIYSAIQDYLNADPVKYGVAAYVGKEDSLFIYDEISKIAKYLEKRVITVEEMQAIVTAANKSRVYFSYFKSIEANIFYYDVIAKSSKSKLQQDSNETVQKWIPDYLVFCLLNDLQEAGYLLSKYELLLNYDLERIFSIYRKANAILKEENKIKTLNHKLITRKMENLSITVVESLSKSKFKLKRRVSKKR